LNDLYWLEVVIALAMVLYYCLICAIYCGNYDPTKMVLSYGSMVSIFLKSSNGPSMMVCCEICVSVSGTGFLRWW